MQKSDRKHQIKYVFLGNLPYLAFASGLLWIFSVVISHILIFLHVSHEYHRECYKAFNTTHGESKAIQQPSEKRQSLQDTSVADIYTCPCKY